MAPLHVGLIGCGTISGIYLKNAAWFDVLEIAACADLIPEHAERRAVEFNIPRVCSVDELLADPTIDMVLNLTIPAAHAQVALAAVRAGKSVYNEKPLTLSRDEGRQLLDEAAARGVRVGCAPDTFLGGSLQTCREIIDRGTIGRPVAATAFLASHGPESWHPNPAFYYQPGAGPLFDMGPYYLTALISLIGPIARVSGAAGAAFDARTIGSEPLRGTTITVNTPTHIAATLEFTSGAIGTMVMSFDVWKHSLPRIEIYGTDGTLSVPDPNRFGDPVRLYRAGDDDWSDVPVTRAYVENSRGVGLADLACALRAGRPHRASGELAYHVLDVMHAALEAGAMGQYVTIESSCERPAPLPADLTVGALDD